MSERPVRPDVRRCTRNKKDGGRCNNGRVLWPHNAQTPDPESCHLHLTAVERAFDVAHRQQWQAECDLLLRPHLAMINGDPACWSWQAPNLRQLVGMTAAERAEAMYAWHEGRCAICGHPNRVTDHDHETGLVRGRLCRSCNSLEGYGHPVRDVFVRYRERNPASIWRVREPYWNPFLHEYAQPRPPRDDDPWKNHPMKGIGL